MLDKNSMIPSINPAAKTLIGTDDGCIGKNFDYENVHTLFSLYRLSRGEQEIMRCLIFIPSKGVSARRFDS